MIKTLPDMGGEVLVSNMADNEMTITKLSFGGLLVIADCAQLSWASCREWARIRRHSRCGSRAIEDNALIVRSWHQARYRGEQRFGVGVVWWLEDIVG